MLEPGLEKDLNETNTHSVVREDKFPIDGGKGPVKLFSERSLHQMQHHTSDYAKNTITRMLNDNL